MIIISLIILFFLIDMFFSYDYLKRFKKRHPNKDWTIVEANIILRNSVRRFGLERGMQLGTLILFGILGLIISYTSHEFHCFLLGVFFMVNAQHIVNLNSLKLLKKIK